MFWDSDNLRFIIFNITQIACYVTAIIEQNVVNCDWPFIFLGHASHKDDILLSLVVRVQIYKIYFFYILNIDVSRYPFVKFVCKRILYINLFREILLTCPLHPHYSNTYTIYISSWSTLNSALGTNSCTYISHWSQ